MGNDVDWYQEVLKANINVHSMYTELRYAILEAGTVIMKYRGKVNNKGKAQKGDSTSAGSAFTDIDEIAQEIILARLYKVNPYAMVNAEEDTPLRKLFRGNDSDITLHLDPIDGTLSYVEGRDMFASGAAISMGDKFTHTLIYAPARGKLYSAYPGCCNVEAVDRDYSTSNFSIRTIFAKKVFSEKGVKVLKDLGFEVISDNYGAHVSSIDAILGNIAGVIHGFTNPHDMLVAAAFARSYNKIPYGIDGNEVTGKDLVMHMENGLPVYERIPVVGYFSDEAEERILPLMLDSALWDKKFSEKRT